MADLVADDRRRTGDCLVRCDDGVMTVPTRPPATQPPPTRARPATNPDVDDAARAAALRRMKLFALALLVAASIVYVVSEWLAPHHTWLGYVRATAEAAMVGALADWFAVTALFRYPLSIPIPHTAIIPTRKNEIGKALGAFVERNFLTPDVVAERLKQAQVAHRLGAWLARPDNARRLGDQASVVLRNVLGVLRDDEVQETIENAVITKIRETSVAPLVGQALDVAMADGRHQQLLGSVLHRVSEELEGNQDTLRDRLSRESPWWVPEAVDERIFTRAFTAVHRILDEIADDPSHPLRESFDQRMLDFAEDLKTSPRMQARAEELKEELLAHPAVREWSGGVWADLKASTLARSADPDSSLRRRTEEALVHFGETLRDEPELQGKVDDWIASATAELVDQSRSEAAAFIAQTVERWDATDTSRRIELAVGRDLQFIRINGTIVGGLAGLIIYSVTQAVH